MAIDDERREVAQRLRELARDVDEVSDFDLARTFSLEATSRYGYDSGDVLRFADLIDPPTQCPYYRSNRHYCSIHDVPAIDREALRALADEMEQAGKDYRYQMVENACCDNLINDAPDDFIDYARRIREALGVTDG